MRSICCVPKLKQNGWAGDISQDRGPAPPTPKLKQDGWFGEIAQDGGSAPQPGEANRTLGGVSAQIADDTNSEGDNPCNLQLPGEGADLIFGSTLGGNLPLPAVILAEFGYVFDEMFVEDTNLVPTLSMDSVDGATATQQVVTSPQESEDGFASTMEVILSSFACGVADPVVESMVGGLPAASDENTGVVRQERRDDSRQVGTLTGVAQQS